MRAAALAGAAALAAGCSFLVDPPHYDTCVDSHGPRCDGDDLVICQGDLDVRTSCAGGCDADWAACVVPSCGNGTTDEGELCDDGNRESGDGCRADCAKLEGCGDQIVDFGEPCDDGNEIDGDGCDCRPADVLVNTTREGKQETPFVAASSAGALIVWEDDSKSAPDTSVVAIRARLVRGTAPVGEDQVVNSQTDFGQIDPRVAASVTGEGFLVVWTDSSGAEPDTSGTAVRGRVVEPSGTLGPPDFVLATTTDAEQAHPTAVGLPDGGYAVAWEDHSLGAGDDSGAAIRLRLFDSDGTPRGDDMVVNTTTTMAQTEPGLAVNADGLLLVVWEDGSRSPSDASDSAIRGRRLRSDGVPVDDDDFAINTTIARDQVQPSAVALADGDFLVVWTDLSGSPDDDGDVRARRVPAAGAPVGSDLTINTTTPAAQEIASAAAVAGGVAVVWEDESGTPPDVSESAVRLRWLDAAGEPTGSPDSMLNAIVIDDQGEPAVAALPDGSVIVVWEDESATSPDRFGPDAVRMKIVAPP